MIKDFDCVEMKRRIQAEIYVEIKDLSDHERTLYFNRHAQTGPLADKWREIKSVDEARDEATRRRREERP
jgi:hypothetical protein